MEIEIFDRFFNGFCNNKNGSSKNGTILYQDVIKKRGSSLYIMTKQINKLLWIKSLILFLVFFIKFIFKKIYCFLVTAQTRKFAFKSIVMQTEKTLINDPLRVSKISWKFRIPIAYNFAVIDPWNLLFS